MKEVEIIKVIEKLIGDIEPVADSSIDRQRKENLEKYFDVFWHMYTEIKWIANRHKDSPYSSQKELGQMCDKFLKMLYNERE